MKKQIIRTFVLFSLLLVAGATQAVSAQVPARLVFSVPFEFVAGGERLPAGDYEITRLSVNSDKALLIRSLDAGKQLAVVTHAGEAGKTPDRAQLTFRQYGDQFFLAEIRTAGASGARAFPVSRAEKRLRIELSSAVGGDRAGEGEDCQTVVVVGALR
ncbi:MAG TPA: hypothetical protein VEY09_17510 [Pyrinomonadaceae bacterium]|nr:hypothetical protein [Pyrinomonadaceae bacterium]